MLGVGLANLATFVWATNAIIGRWIRNDIAPLTVSASRVLLAAAILAFILRRRLIGDFRLLRKDWIWIGAMALTGVIGFTPVYYLGLRYTSAANGVLIQGLAPLITAVLAGWIISEPASRKQKIGAIIGLIGVAGLISGGDLSFWASYQANAGDLWILLAAFLWALYSVLVRRVTAHRPPMVAAALPLILGLPVLIALAVVELQHFPANIRPATVLALIYCGLVPTLVGVWSWVSSIRILGAGGAMVFYNTLPLYGVVLAVILLGERLSAGQIGFGAIIIGGAFWSSWER